MTAGIGAGPAHGSTACRPNGGMASVMFAALGNAHSWGPALLYLAIGIAAVAAFHAAIAELVAAEDVDRVQVEYGKWLATVGVIAFHKQIFALH